MGAYILQAITPRAVIFNNEILSDYSIPNLVVLYLHNIIERIILLFHSSVPFQHSIPLIPDTHFLPTKISHYTVWENLAGENWWIWQIVSCSPKFSSPIFTDTPKMYLAYALTVAYSPNFPHQ